MLMCVPLTSFGADYWQQEVHTIMDVELDDVNHKVKGNIEITYINNSPNSLDTIFILLYPNAYKSIRTDFARQQLENKSTDFYYAGKEDKGSITGLDFSVNGSQATWALMKGRIDVGYVVLPSPLAPGGEVRISTPFVTKFPKVFSRLGHEGQFYAATQWFPKPAVYDVDGWHPYPYLDQGEFYYEYGSYDVSITLPDNYQVGATGELQNQEEIDRMNRLARETRDELAAGKIDSTLFKSVQSSPTNKTLRFKAEMVHDFAWFAGKQLRVLTGSVKLPNSGREVTTWTLFPANEMMNWKNSVDFVNEGVLYYSKWVGDYPYSQCTAVGGPLSAGGGMEYPMVTIIDGGFSGTTLEQVIVHEVGHNWFQGILGTNERLYPWMDEGINSYYEQRTMETAQYQHPSTPGERLLNLIPDEGTLNDRLVQHLERLNVHQPLSTRSEDLLYINYGLIIYQKGADMMKWLEGYLGQSTFDKCMQAYFEKWKFKHPSPKAMQEVMEECSGKDLSWFFEGVVPTANSIDLEIRSYGEGKTVVRNHTGIPVPFPISSVRNGQVIETKWFEGFPGEEAELSHDFGEFDLLVIDWQNYIPEVTKSNNRLKSSGICKRSEPLEIKMLAGFDDPSKKRVYYLPILSYNEQDRSLYGLGLHNMGIPIKKFEWSLMPMFSTRAKDLTGLASINYTITPKKGIQFIRLNAKAKHFNTSTFLNDRQGDDLQGFYQVSPSITMQLKKKRARSTQTHEFKVQTDLVKQEIFNYSVADSSFKSAENNYYVNRFNYMYANKKTLNPLFMGLEIEQGNNYAKLLTDFKFFFNIPNQKRGIELRFFTGSFLYNNMTIADTDQPTPADVLIRTGGITGDDDYANRGFWFSRRFSGSNIGWMNQMISLREGGLKVRNAAFPEGKSNEWVISVNAKAGLPLPIPVSVFVDVATFSGAGNISPTSEVLMFNGGVLIPIVNNVVEVYLPIFASNDIKTFWNGQPSWGERITFMIDFEQIDPIKIRNNLHTLF